MKVTGITKTICICLVTAILMSGCASTTLFQTTPNGASVYISGQKVGTTPYNYTDKKAAFSSTPVTFRKDGYQDLNIILKRNEKADIGAIVAGLYLIVPYFWLLKYNPTHNYELQKMEGIRQDEAITADLSISNAGVPDKTEENPEAAEDIEGNVYNTVRIGSQTWFAENLKTTKYNDGTDIPLITDETDWNNLAAPGYCWYNNNPEGIIGTSYGALYNWHAVSAGNICPADWHVPTDNDWNMLEMYLGMSRADVDLTGFHTINKVGGKLKSTGTRHWSNPNTEATNESGFTALPAGRRNYDGKYKFITYCGLWWTATEHNSSNAWCRGIYYSISDIVKWSNNKKYGFSVRCLKD